MSNRDTLFNNGTDTGEGGLYYMWEQDGVTLPQVTERTIFYDSNIAFTSGNASISDNSTKTVPNLYDTLKGLNQRINNVEGGGASISGITTTINTTNNDVTMKAVDGNTALSLTIDATAIKFKFNTGAVYSMEDIFAMLEELRARTHAIKTSEERVNIETNYIMKKAAIGSDPWTTNYISPEDE